MHSLPGKVTNIRQHSDGKHAEITVTHGKRKRSKGSDGTVGALNDYGQHDSRHTLTKADAANYKLGQKVHSGITPREEAEGEGDDNEMNESEDGAATEREAVPGKQSPAKNTGGGKPSRAKGRLLAAMGGKK